MKKFAFISLSVLLFACDGNDAAVAKPEKLLTEAEMANIMYDAALLQAMKSYMPSKLSENNIQAGKYIYEKYKIDSAVYVQNSRYYASQMEVYEKIQKNVADRLEKEKKAAEKPAANKKEQKPVKKVNPTLTKAKRDSLRSTMIKANRPK